jgi:hypothetical protein
VWAFGAIYLSQTHRSQEQGNHAHRRKTRTYDPRLLSSIHLETSNVDPIVNADDRFEFFSEPTELEKLRQVCGAKRNGRARIAWLIFFAKVE